MICQALKDILKGVEFKGSEASFCESQCLWKSAAWLGKRPVTYKLMADLRRREMRLLFVGLALSHDRRRILA